MQKKESKEESLRVNLKLLGVVVGLFVLAVGVLVMAPAFIKTAQDRIVLSGDQLNLESKNFASQIQPPQLVTYTQIVDSGKAAPVFSARAVVAQDLTTGELLYQKNAHQRLAIASTTKIMTALVSSEFFKSADVLTVPKEALVGGSSMGLTVSERLSFRSLLYGMLLNSGNDAAFTIAANYPGGVNGFVAAMNRKAATLDLKDTNFQNPAGFDNPNHYSSAFDLARIADVAANSPQLSKVVSTKETFVYSWDKEHTFSLRNLNKLLEVAGVVGIKTGTTDEAGQSLVGLVDRNNHKVVTVMLGSSDRFNETTKLIDWVYDNFTWKQVTASK